MNGTQFFNLYRTDVDLNKPKKENQLEYVNRFLEHLLLQVRTSPKESWGRYSMYLFIQEQYKSFLHMLLDEIQENEKK